MPRPPFGWTSSWVAVGGLRMHALERDADGVASGSAVLVPGLVTASRSMLRLSRELARLGMTTSVLDLAGFGYSDKPRHALTVGEQARLVAGWLAATGRSPAYLVGNSYGCQVAAATAASTTATTEAADPPAVRRLALVSPTASPRVRRALGWLARMPAPRAWPPAVRASSSASRRARSLAAVHRLLGDDPPLRALNAVEYAVASLPRAAGTIRAAVRHDIEADLARVGVPTLVLRGDRERLSEPGWGERLAAAAPDARLQRISGAGHDMFWAAADVVARRLAAFGAAQSTETP